MKNIIMNQITTKNKIINLESMIIVIILILLLVVPACSTKSSLKESESYISTGKISGYFTLSATGQSTPLYASPEDYPGVLRVLNLFQTDITKVTDAKPVILTELTDQLKKVVIIGTIGKSPVINRTEKY